MRMTRVALATLSLAALASGPAAAQAPPPYLLAGVIMPEAGEPMAILEDPQTHEQTLHPLGAEIGGVHLTRILRDRVILTSGGVPIEVRLAGTPPAPPSRTPAPVRVPPNRARRGTAR